MLRSVVRPSGARYLRTVLQAIRSETDFQSHLQQNKSCVVGFFDDEHESSRIAKSDLNTISAEFANIPFFEVSGAQYPQLMRNHEIQRLPAVVAFSDGNVLESSVNVDKNVMRSIISKLPDAKKSATGGIVSMLFGDSQGKQQEQDLSKRVEEAHDINARKEWETSPEEAVYKKHPLQEPDTSTDNRAGLNTLASGLKEGYDEAMDDVSQRARKQRRQRSDNDADSKDRDFSNRKERSRDQEKQDSDRDFRSSNRQQNSRSSEQFDENESSTRLSTQATEKANKDVRDTTRRDRKVDNTLNRKIKKDQSSSDSSESMQASSQSDDTESRHGELEASKRSVKSGSGNIDMPKPNDQDAKFADPQKRGASNDARRSAQSSSKSKTQKSDTM